MSEHLGQGGPDEYQTPSSALRPLMTRCYFAHTPVLEPCAGQGWLASALRTYAQDVYADDPAPGTVGGDLNFLVDGPRHPGMPVITNPPWSLKDLFIERLVHEYHEHHTEWALLLPLSALGGKRRQALYRVLHPRGVGVVMLGGRVRFGRPDGRVSAPHVEAAWFCSPGFVGAGRIEFTGVA